MIFCQLLVNPAVNVDRSDCCAPPRRLAPPPRLRFPFQRQQLRGRHAPRRRIGGAADHRHSGFAILLGHDARAVWPGGRPELAVGEFPGWEITGVVVVILFAAVLLWIMPELVRYAKISKR